MHFIIYLFLLTIKLFVQPAQPLEEGTKNAAFHTRAFVTYKTIY